MLSGHNLSNETIPTPEEYDHDVQQAIKGILFLFVSFAVGVIIRQLLLVTKSHLPYTVVLFLVGMLLGVVNRSYALIRPYTQLSQINPDVLMQTFLPVLIFESAYTMDAHMFMKSLVQCLILSLPGLVICSLMIAAYTMTVLAMYHWDWITAFLFGSILSATDPVAVVALLKECGISPTLTILIEGESLLNDGSAIVMFKQLVEIMVKEQTHIEPLQMLKSFLIISIASPAFGYIMGKISSWWLVTIYQDAVLEFTITFCFANITYYVAETIFHISGVLSVVVLGVVLSSHKSSFSPETEKAVHSSWEMMSYYANTLIFIIVGIIITENASKNITPFDLGLAVCTYVFSTVFRLLMVIIVSPVLSRLGYGLTWKTAIALVWGGLRGAVGLALALMLSENPRVDDTEIADKVLFQLSVTIVLTLVVNGTTMKSLLNMLGLTKVSRSRQLAMSNALALLRDTASKSMKIQKRDDFLGGANWLWVESHTLVGNPYQHITEVDKSTPYTPYHTSQCHQCKVSHVIQPTDAEREEMEEETRLRVLKSVKSLYWNYFEHCIVTSRSVQILTAAVDDAIDKPGAFVDVIDLKRRYMTVPVIVQKLRSLLVRIADKMKEYEVPHKKLAARALELTGFRHFCLRMYMKPYFDVLLLLITILNIIPIVTECYSTHSHSHSDSPEIDEIFFHVLNIVFLLIYIWEAVIKIGALGFRKYFRGHWNKFAFFVTVVGIFDLAADIYLSVTDIKAEHCYLALSRLIRFVRLLELYKLQMRIAAKLVLLMKSVSSAKLYEAYDLGHVYVAAQKEVMKRIDFIADYKPCGAKPLKESEKGILEMIKSLAKIQKDHPGVTLALKSHKAAMKILNDVLIALKELFDMGLIDEVEFKLLLQEIDVLKRDIARSPRTLRGAMEVEDILRRVDWITDENLLNVILQNYIVQDYHAYQNIHEDGDLALGISVVTTGVVKVMGEVKGEECSRLPNTDSVVYFMSKGKFFDYIIPYQCLGIFGFLVNSRYVTTAKCETSVSIIHISYGTLIKAEQELTSGPPLSYSLWRSVSLKIALPIIAEQPRYYGMTHDTLKILLENSVLPDLSKVTTFDIEKPVRGMVLIQGKVRDAAAGEIYIGPKYISSVVKRLHLDEEDLDDRPRIVLLIIPETSYILPHELDWSGHDSLPTNTDLCQYHTVKHRRSTLGTLLEDVSDSSKSIPWKSKHKTSSSVPLNENETV